MIWQLVFLGVAMGMNNARLSVALGTKHRSAPSSCAPR